MDEQPGTIETDESASPAEYLRAARAHLRTGLRKRAYSLLLRASGRYPDHPLILSYCGWLQAEVDRMHQSGLAACRRALFEFRTDDPEIANAVYPVLHLNLGRTLSLAGKKKDALEHFNRGLRYDRGHYELKKEVKALGVRKPPVISFLSRSNPLNRCLGKMLHKRDDRPPR